MIYEFTNWKATASSEEKKINANNTWHFNHKAKQSTSLIKQQNATADQQSH